MASDRRRLKREMEQQVKAYAKNLLANDARAKGLSVATNLYLYPKRPARFSREYPIQLVQIMLLSETHRNMSNAALVEWLSGRYEGYKASPSIMGASLPGYAKEDIHTVLVQHGVFGFDLEKNNTLSKIKMALRGKSAARKAKQSYEVRISFADDALVVGERRWPLTRHVKGYDRVQVGNQWLRRDVLEKLLRKSI